MDIEMKTEDGRVLTNYLEELHGGQDDWHKHRDGIYHASTLGKCPRNNYYTITENLRPDSSAYVHFELGHRLEALYLEALKHEYGDRYVKTDIPVKLEFDDYTIVGETDPVRVSDNGDIVELFEIKTTGNLKYTKKEPKRVHVCQVHVYMAALELTQAKIVYVNKYNLETQVHVVEWSDAIWVDIMDRTDTLHKAIEAGEPPDTIEETDFFCNAPESECCKNAD